MARRWLCRTSFRTWRHAWSICPKRRIGSTTTALATGCSGSRSTDCRMPTSRGRRTLAPAYPMAVTPSEVRAAADTPAARGQLRPLRGRLGLDLGRQLIVRVDRVEPTKNIVRGFAAYEQLLASHAEWRGRVVFLALLVRSRESVGEYQAYAEDVERR